VDRARSVAEDEGRPLTEAGVVHTCVGWIGSSRIPQGWPLELTKAATGCAFLAGAGCLCRSVWHSSIFAIWSMERGFGGIKCRTVRSGAWGTEGKSQGQCERRLRARLGLHPDKGVKGRDKIFCS